MYRASLFVLLALTALQSMGDGFSHPMSTPFHSLCFRRRQAIDLERKKSFDVFVNKAYSSSDEVGQAIHALNASNGFAAALPWVMRLVTGMATYVGFVAVCDRPRGTLIALENEQIQVRPSTVPGAGLGLFANLDLPSGFTLGTYPGVVLPIHTNLAKLQRHPECEAYIWRFSDSKYIIDPTNDQGKLDDYCYGGNDGQFLSQWLFQSTFLGALQKVPTTLCRINEPPKGKDVNVVTEENTERRYVLFKLERDVYAGEELFIDYGLTYDRSRYRANPGE